MGTEDGEMYECQFCAGDMDQKDCQLVNAAEDIRQQAYCPYSKFAVGAALRTTDDRIFTGVNVENASYGLTVCAERNAIAAAVAGGMKPGELQTLVIVAGSGTVVSPCGACRQVIAEFAAPNCMVITCNTEDDEFSTWALSDLLPEAFEI